MVNEYVRPASLEEALELMEDDGSVASAGGTFLLTGYEVGRGRDMDCMIDVLQLLPSGVTRSGNELSIGSGTTFQALIDSKDAPACLKAAALSMANRNTRNRATVGGNLGANKACASLPPILLALGAKVEFKARASAPLTLDLDKWLAAPEGLVLRVIVPMAPGTLAAAGRASRTACDLATATVGVSYRLENGVIRGLRVALGGFSPHARLFPDLAALFEGTALPPKADIERVAKPLLTAISDHRGSADYKKQRGAVILADAMHAAEALS
ncbi:MAG: FAD binding domain-containing protein [Spirochaetales bacterium]|nr:FAD binding domain-containing protein [Spirochaetales bacterium]MBP7263544.1 FAD binding domain-containing protein [Spirochaetia bacterium]